MVQETEQTKQTVKQTEIHHLSNYIPSKSLNIPIKTQDCQDDKKARPDHMLSTRNAFGNSKPQLGSQSEWEEKFCTNANLKDAREAIFIDEKDIMTK